MMFEVHLVMALPFLGRDDEQRRSDLRARAAAAPFLRGWHVVCALWVREGPAGEDIVTPEAVMAALR
jgi:hypothetical protein